MNLIVAVDNNWGIGWHDQLLFRIREDMKRIKALTTGKVIILGRKTLQTFPGGQPLANRVNIVLTRQADFVAEPAIVAHNLTELADILAGYPDDDLFVLGGSSIYRQLLPHCRKAYVTRVDLARPADSHFPNLDACPGWLLAAEEACVLPGVIHTPAGDEPTDISCRFCLYEQADPRPLRPADDNWREGETSACD